MQKSSYQINARFRNLLRIEYSKRSKANSRYSLRAFAKHLKIEASSLSQILSGKRLLSDNKIHQLCNNIGIKAISQEHIDNSYATLDKDSFAFISDWYHFALLDLVLLPKFKEDPTWISKKLEIDETTAKEALERLIRMNLLVRKAGKIRKAQPYFTNHSEEITSTARKEYQRQVIGKALKAVDECPQSLKDITSMTIAADSSKLAEAQKMIRKFRRTLCDFLETGKKDSVYHMTIQLYPVAKPEAKN